MKKSNIILMSILILAMTWLLLSGWLQANAYNLMKSGKSCSYVVINDRDNVKHLPLFQHIRVKIDSNLSHPALLIRYGEACEIGYGDGIKKAISERVSGDTLYLFINKKAYHQNIQISINLPSLKSVNILSSNDTILYGKYFVMDAIISDFNGKNLSIISNGHNYIKLNNNKLNKLEIRGNFYRQGKIEILKYTDCDSIDVDIEGRQGTFIMGSGTAQMSKVNPRQWLSIKVPGSYRVEAEASVARKIILKK